MNSNSEERLLNIKPGFMYQVNTYMGEHYSLAHYGKPGPIPIGSETSSNAGENLFFEFLGKIVDRAVRGR